MIVICEECGQKYELNPSIMTRRKAKFKCKKCNFLMTIYKYGKGAESVKEVHAEDLMAAANQIVSAEDLIYTREAPVYTPSSESRFSIGFGLRAKLMLFFLVPLILALTVGGYFFVKQMDVLGNAMTDESLRMLTSVAENEVTEYSKAIALQIQIYLSNHPELKKGNFNNDVDFSKIAVQRITLTMRGDTSLYESTPDGKQIFWAHADPNYVGRDTSSMQNLLGRGFNDFVKIIRMGQDGKESSGHFVQSIGGRSQDNFMVCTPVVGTPYYVASSTYLSESSNVMDVPMSPLFKMYLDLEAFRSLENEWWKKK
jgi:hypothetical protein